MSRLLIILCVGLFSCSEINNRFFKTTNATLIKIDNASSESIDLIDIVDSIRFYPLESCPDCYFNSIVTKMEMHDSLLVVFNARVSPGIKVFNYYTGRLLAQLDSGVKGRDDLFWQSIGDFEIVDGQIYVYNYHSQKNYTYSFEGDLLDEFDVGVQLSEFEIDQDGRFAIFKNFDDECYEVFWIDQFGILDSLAIDSRIDYCSFYRTDPDDVFFSDLENQLFLIPSYGNALFIKPFADYDWKTIFLEFDKGAYPQEYYDLLKESNHQKGFGLIQDYNNNFDYALPINSFVSLNEGYVFTNYMKNGHYINFIAKDLGSSKTMKLANSINNYFLSPHLLLSDESGAIVSIIDGDEFYDAQLKIESKDIKISEAYYDKTNVKEIMDLNKSYPNNILVKYYLTFPIDQ